MRFPKTLILLMFALTLPGCSGTPVLDKATSIHITSVSMFTDGGTVVLHGTTDRHEEFGIRVNQRCFPVGDAPGRLFFNGHIVEVRSNQEKKILKLLKDATFGQERVDLKKFETMEYQRNAIVE